MIVALILLVVGVAVGALSIWGIMAAGFTVYGILWALGLAVGGALVVSAWGVAHDKINPTSRKI